MKRRVFISGIVVVATAATLTLFASASQARRQTTSPGLAPVTLYVTLSDKGIKYTMWQQAYDEGRLGLIVANGLDRGEVAIFQVTNAGKKPHDFAAFGKKTGTLKAGAKAHFRVALLHRGTFAYSSTLDKGKKAFRGVLKVY